MSPESQLQGKKNQLLVKNSGLSGGIAGNLQTLQAMKKIAKQRAGHPMVRKLALNILNYYNIDSHQYGEEARAIGTYVQQKVRYVKDPTGIEQLHDPVTMIDQIQRGIARGDCDDMALLTASLLYAIGHTPKFRCVRYKSKFGPYNHIYVVDYVNVKGKKQRIVLDCIIKDKAIGFEIGHMSGDEYSI
jgi:hypothetical protein